MYSIVIPGFSFFSNSIPLLLCYYRDTLLSCSINCPFPSPAPFLLTISLFAMWVCFCFEYKFLCIIFWITYMWYQYFSVISLSTLQIHPHCCQWQYFSFYVHVMFHYGKSQTQPGDWTATPSSIILHSKLFVCAKSCSLVSNSFVLKKWGRVYDEPHFTKEKTETED